MNFHATDDPADIFQRKHALRVEFIHPLECLLQTCPALKDIGFNVLFFKQFDKNCGSFRYIWQERLWPPWCAVVLLRQLRRQEKMVYEIRNIHLLEWLGRSLKLSRGGINGSSRKTRNLLAKWLEHWRQGPCLPAFVLLERWTIRFLVNPNNTRTLHHQLGNLDSMLLSIAITWAALNISIKS